MIPELLVPAGNIRKLRVALAYGADAVYIGASGFSMRPDEAAFTHDQMAEAVKITHAAGKKLYAAINTLLFQDDLAKLEKWLNDTSYIPFDALIISDPGAFLLVKKIRPDVEIHISTQMSTANSGSAAFWRDAGAKRVILAREASLDDAKKIMENGGIPVEIFVHGAMCVAISGRCLLSAYTTGFNANQGQCKHTCRWSWQLVESKRPGESIPVFETGKQTILLGSTDLCLIEHIPELIKSGVSSLKIEGRMKGEYYVGVVTRVYRAALDLYAKNPENFIYDPSWMKELESVSHRSYMTGFAFGYPADKPESLQAEGCTSGTYEFMGLLDKCRDNIYPFELKNRLNAGETIEWIAPHGKCGEVKIKSIKLEGKEPVELAHPGRFIEVELDTGSVILPDLTLLRRKRK
jgi:U32 family peptidase